MLIRRNTFVFAAAASLIGNAALGAQELRGVVREGTTQQPVPGAVLLLLDSAGVSRARNITDQRGAYRIAVSSWMKRMRVVRIGFRPSEVAIPSLSLPTDVAQLDIVLTTLPTMLEPVQVSSGAKCSARKDRIVALSLLEQARAGLLATVVAQEKQPAEMIRLRTTEFIDDNGSVKALRVRTDSNDRVRHAFQAVRSAADFVKLGFYDAAKGDLLYAPDAETLLDNDFRDGYCFLLRDRDVKRPNAVGLGFAPAKMQNGRIDVDGTLWIDTVSRRLIEIQYSYVGFSRFLEQAHPGGRVQFHSLANDVVVIDHFGVRLPSIEVDSSERNVDGRLKKTVVRAQQSGGVVASARWPDGFTWNAPLATLRLKVLNRDSQPDPLRLLLLDETDYQAVSDSSGMLTIGRLVPGPYSAIMRDSTLATIGITLQTSLKFAVRDSETIAREIVSPSARDYVEQACKNTGPPKPNRTANWFIARVVDSAGKPVTNTEWHAYYRKGGNRGAPVTGLGIVMTNRDNDWPGIDDAGGTTSSDGLLQYCGGALHFDDLVRLETRRSSNDPWQTLDFPLTGIVTAVRMTVTPRVK